MPFRSEAQRKFMWKHHPDIAAQWMAEFPDQDLSLLPPSVGSGKKKTKTDNNSNAAHSMEKEAMSDERDRILYNLYMKGEQPGQEKSAGLSSLKNAIGAAASANAASRADQIGIALGTSVTAGITNNYVHDTLVERRKQKKEKELSQAADMEKINLTLADIQHKLHSNHTSPAPEVEKAASWYDAFRPTNIVNDFVGMNKDVVKVSEEFATNGAKAKGNIETGVTKLFDLVNNANSHKQDISEAVTKAVAGNNDKLTFSKDISALLPDFRNFSEALQTAGTKFSEVPTAGLNTLSKIKAQLKTNLLEHMASANAGHLDAKALFSSQPILTVTDKIVPNTKAKAIMEAMDEVKGFTGMTRPYADMEEVMEHMTHLAQEGMHLPVVEHMYEKIYAPLLEGTKKSGEKFNKVMLDLATHARQHNLMSQSATTADLLNNGASHIEAAKAGVRKGEKMVAGLMAAPYLMDTAAELYKYPSWRRGAIKETAAINQALQAAERSKTIARRAGIAGAVGIAGALAGGAIYNKMHDPVNPMQMPSLPKMPSLHIPESIVNLFKGKSTKVTAHPSGKVTIESSPTKLLPSSAHAHSQLSVIDSGEEKETHEVPEWMRKASSGVDSAEIVDGVKGIGAYAKEAWHSSPWWHKALGAAGVAGAGYLAHEAVKTYGADNLLAHTHPGLHAQKHTLKHQLRMPSSAEPVRHGMHPLAKYGLGAAALLGTGYLYNKAYPGKEEGEGQSKAANYMSPAVVAELEAARHAAMAGKGKALGIGLLAGLAIPSIGRGLAGAYNMVQQNKIQRDMVAIQQMQAASQMGMGGMMGGMGYTNPVALQQSTLY
jgi:hypothetical protein